MCHISCILASSEIAIERQKAPLEGKISAEHGTDIPFRVPKKVTLEVNRLESVATTDEVLGHGLDPLQTDGAAKEKGKRGK